MTLNAYKHFFIELIFTNFQLNIKNMRRNFKKKYKNLPHHNYLKNRTYFTP